MSKKEFDYNQHMDIKFDHHEHIDVNAIVAACTDPWFNQTLSKVNDSVVRIGIVEGEYHWHKHDEDDEFFFVLSGQLLIDLEDKTIELNPNRIQIESELSKSVFVFTVSGWRLWSAPEY